MLQLRADNERMQRTIARNGLEQDDDVTRDEFTQQSLGDSSGATLSTLQKKLSIGDPTTFGLSVCLFVRRRFSHWPATANIDPYSQTACLYLARSACDGVCLSAAGLLYKTVASYIAYRLIAVHCFYSPGMMANT